jgi:hypothetical protein
MDKIISREMLNKVWAMYTRANLTKSQALDDLKSGKFNDAQCSMVCHSMDKVIKDCNDVIHGVFVDNGQIHIPEILYVKADKLSKAINALARVA